MNHTHGGTDVPSVGQRTGHTARADHPRGARVSRTPIRRSSLKLRTMLLIVASAGGTGLLVAACSSSALPEKSGSAAAPAGAHAPSAQRAPGFSDNGAASSAPEGAKELAKLGPAQSIVYTALLVLRVKDTSGAASAASGDVTGVGGYVADEQQTGPTGAAGHRSGGLISLRLKIPVADYRPTLAKLFALGHQVRFSERAQDVTQQVADVASRVTSAQAAIRQLRALLSRAGNVGALLSVQDEINSQETALEALLAQQRALAHETSYATVTLTVIGPKTVVHRPPHKNHRGLVAGLSTGWRALKAVVVWLLTALGTVLPFAVPIALVGGIVVIGRRRITRRRTPPAAAPPTAAS
jgi:Domain of unknown function (DUF4349)